MKRDIVVASVEAIVAGTNALLAKKQDTERINDLEPEKPTGPIEGL